MLSVFDFSFPLSSCPSFAPASSLFLHIFLVISLPLSLPIYLSLSFTLSPCRGFTTVQHLFYCISNVICPSKYCLTQSLPLYLTLIVLDYILTRTESSTLEPRNTKSNNTSTLSHVLYLPVQWTSPRYFSGLKRSPQC